MLPIISAIRDDDDRDFVEQQYLKHRKQLYKIALEVTKSHEDAEDCVNNTVVILINYLERYRSLKEEYQAAYLKKCCKHAAIAIYKQNRKTRENESSLTDEECRKSFDVVDEDENIEEQVISAETQARIKAILLQMGEADSNVLFYKYFIGLSNIKIAEVMGESVNTVTVRLHRARKKLLSKKGDELYDILQK